MQTKMKWKGNQLFMKKDMEEIANADDYLRDENQLMPLTDT